MKQSPNPQNASAALRSARQSVVSASIRRVLANGPTACLLTAASLWGFQANAQEVQPPRTVLETRQVQSGGKTITFQRLAPRAVETVPLQPVTTTAAPSATYRPPANWSPPISISLGATIYENGVSELSWYRDGAVHRVLSSLDFSFVAGLGQFQWEGKNYLVFIAPSKVNNTLRSSHLAPRPSRPTPQLPVDVRNAIAQDGKSRLVITQTPKRAGTDTAMLNALGALHAYFDAHRAELIAKHEAAAAARLAQEDYLKAHPPEEAPVVIQFWPKRGSRSTRNSNTSGSEEGAK